MEINAQYNLGSRALAGILRGMKRELTDSSNQLQQDTRLTSPSDDVSAFTRSQELQSRKDNALELASDLDEDIDRLNTAEKNLEKLGGLLGNMADLASLASAETDSTVRTDLGRSYDRLYSEAGTLVSSSRFQGGSLLDGTLDTSAGGSAKTARIDEGASDTFSYEILDSRLGNATGLNLSAAASAETDWAGGGGQSNASNYLSAIISEDSGENRLERNIHRVESGLSVLESARSSLREKAANYQSTIDGISGLSPQAEDRNSSLDAQLQTASKLLDKSNDAMQRMLGLVTRVDVKI